MAKKRDPKQIVGLTLRLREELRGRLEASAEKSGRSLNQEVIERLEQSFRRELVEDSLEALKRFVHNLEEFQSLPSHAREEMVRRFGTKKLSANLRVKQTGAERAK